MKDKLEIIGEWIVGAIIVGAVFWVPWLFYFITGEYMQFGAGE